MNVLKWENDAQFSNFWLNDFYYRKNKFSLIRNYYGICTEILKYE